MINIDHLREDTPGCSHCLHFNNAGASLPPIQVTLAIQDYLYLESLSGGYEIADTKTSEIEHFYSGAAQLIGAKPQTIAFTSSATNAYTRALSCIPFEADDTVLIANEDYISNQLAFLSLQKRFNIKLIRSKSLPEGGVDTDDLRTLMDKHKPKLVSLSHVPTNTGLVQPVEEVGILCRERDILYLVDACQSVGQLPVDVKKVQCDFLSVTMRKFLRGPRGAGFLYVSDRVLEAEYEPLFIDMRGANWISADHYRARPDARRFEDWELPYALLIGASAAVAYALAVGIDEIAARNQMLCKYLLEGLDSVGLRILDIGAEQSSIITVDMKDKSPQQTIAFLRERNINTSASMRNYAQVDFATKGVDWALRISPHYYNTENEIDMLFDALEDLVNG